MRRSWLTFVGMVLLFSFIAGCLAAIGYGQEKKVEAPKLKPDVALAIKDTQLQLSNLQLQYTQLVQQYTTKLQQQFATALKDSGLDDTKYQLDPNTLVVSEKPKPEVKKDAK